MLRITTGLPHPKQPELATLAYLKSRVREEADAAARAKSIEATVAHVMLATRYAERLTDCCGGSAASERQSWVEEERLW